MRFDRIELRNFKPYESADLNLDDGVTVFHGVNGSGKSSLLEAAFFALYGARAIDGTLDEVLTNGEDESEISLRFTHEGDTYRVHRRLRRSSERVATAECTLEGPDGTVEGARDVRARVTRLLRMDAEAFVNCAYVRQGEVNKLINATPSDRRAMIDDLLQLGTLEAYRDRAGDARLGVEDVLSEKRGALGSVEDRVAELEAEGLHGRLNDLESDLSGVESEIDRFEENRERARESLAAAEETLDEHEARREELSEVEAEIEEVEAAVRGTERERDDLAERAREHAERAETLDERIAELLDGTDLGAADAEAVAERRAALTDERESLRERLGALGEELRGLGEEAETRHEEATDLLAEATAERERAAELEREAGELADAVEELATEVGNLETSRAEARAAFEDAPVGPGGAAAHREEAREALEAAREERAGVREKLATARSRVEEAEELLAAGKCPECGQPVEGSPHVESLDERRATVADLEADLTAVAERVEAREADLEAAEALVAAADRIDRLDEELANKRETLAARREAVASKRERAASAREAAADLVDEAEAAAREAEGAREAAETKRTELGELNARNGDITDAVERLDDLADALAARDEARAAAERLREKRADLADRNDERRDRLSRLRERREELREAVDEERIEAARAEAERAEAYLEKVAEKLAELREERDGLQGRIGAVRESIGTLEELREERDELRERVAALESVHEEVGNLEELYGDLRAELRRRNVESLERLLNETFDLVYANDAYARIELDDDYELTVVQKDGATLAPDQLSGGERALFNLSLRCAIYRLLAEGIDGAAPMPPLILDEPTVFLDAGHVSRLVDLIEEMRDLGVRQTVIVSHDEELVGAADALVTVEKDPTTNRSSVRRERAPSVSALDGTADD